MKSQTKFRITVGVSMTLGLAWGIGFLWAIFALIQELRAQGFHLNW